MRALYATLIVFMTAATAVAQPSPPRTVTIDAGDIDISARLYTADAGQPAPAVVLLHGWDWPHIDPAAYMAGSARAFQRAGFSVLVPSMRGWPPTGGVDDCAGSQVDDVLALLDWLAARPGVDARGLFVSGYSQGGQVALLTATRTGRVRAVAAFAPVVDPGSWGAETNVEGIRDYVMQECGGPDGWPARSALARARHLRAPVLLVHGDADLRVPTAQSTRLFRALRALDHPVQLHRVSAAGHDMDRVLQPALAIAFFTRHLRHAAER